MGWNVLIMVYCVVDDMFVMYYVGEVFSFFKQGKDGYGGGFVYV